MESQTLGPNTEGDGCGTRGSNNNYLAALEVILRSEETMDIAEVKKRVKKIKKLAKTDAEAAHSEEDKLYLDVLKYIAGFYNEGSTHIETLLELAHEAIKSQDIEFTRHCA